MKLESLQTTGHIDSLRKEIIESIRALNVSSQYVSYGMAKLPTYKNTSGSAITNQECKINERCFHVCDNEIFKQEIVSSLRSDLQDMFSNVPSNISISNVSPSPAISELYQTHLYTQL